MQRAKLIWAVGIATGFLALAGRGQNSEPTASIDPKADEILKQMGRLLGETPLFSVKADKMIDYVLENGQKIQLSNRTQVVVHRPGKLWARTIGDTGTEQGWYAHKSLILLNEDQNRAPWRHPHHRFLQRHGPPGCPPFPPPLRFRWGLPIPR